MPSFGSRQWHSQKFVTGERLGEGGALQLRCQSCQEGGEKEKVFLFSADWELGGGGAE